MSTVIKVENLSKRYYLSHKDRERFPTLRDAITRTASNMGKRLLHPLRASSGLPLEGLDSTEEFWALDDVSFEVKQGDRVGIIGRNGAGKSTLLKILSRITEPTKGRVSIRGRTASLLEVGTGFHPELTGRENIFLNGAILGMSKADIKRKFDEIVAFSEVERFLDTPVKRYSSGMYIRLAFAVAAHLEPEILIVDEVLAVGDISFQKKCLGKMEEVGKEGRTVVFVSHNVAAVNQLCTQGIILNDGRLTMVGKASEAIGAYIMSGVKSGAEIDLTTHLDRHGCGRVKFTSASIVNQKREVCQDFSVGDELSVSFTTMVCEREIKFAKLAVEIRTADGLPLCNMIDSDSGFQFDLSEDKATFFVQLEDLRLYPGSYYISLWLGNETCTEIFDYVKDCLMFNVLSGGNLTMRRLPREAGLLFWTPKWSRK